MFGKTKVTKVKTAQMKVLSAPQMLSFYPTAKVHIYVIAIRTDVEGVKIEPLELDSRRVPEIGETVSARNRWYEVDSPEDDFIYEG